MYFRDLITVLKPYLRVYFRDLSHSSSFIFSSKARILVVSNHVTNTITVPNNYGWVVLGAGIVPVVTSMWLGGVVMKARKQYDVKYPNLYVSR